MLSRVTTRERIFFASCRLVGRQRGMLEVDKRVGGRGEGVSGEGGREMI